VNQILADFGGVLPGQVQPMQDGVGPDVFDPPNRPNAIPFDQHRQDFQDHR
jgi:hypothetical protein